MELEHYSIAFLQEKILLADKKKLKSKLSLDWSIVPKIVQELEAHPTFKCMIVTLATNASLYDINFVKEFDEKQFKKTNQVRKWSCRPYTKLIACIEINQVELLCEKMKMYKYIFSTYKDSAIFENDYIFVILYSNGYYYVLDKTSSLKKTIKSIYWYWMYCLLNRLKVGIPNTTQYCLVGHDNVFQKILLTMVDCTALTLTSYKYKTKKMTSIDMCSNQHEVNQLQKFLQETLSWITEPFLGEETNIWFKVCNTPTMNQCGYWCPECKKAPKCTQEDLDAFLLMDVY